MLRTRASSPWKGSGIQISSQRQRNGSQLLCGIGAALCGALISAVACGAPPTISQVSLRGLRIGGTTTLAIDGSALMPGAELVLPVPIAHQTVRPGSGPQHVEFDVTVDGIAMPPSGLPAWQATGSPLPFQLERAIGPLTPGTYDLLVANGIAAERVNKIGDPSPNVLDVIKERSVDLVVNDFKSGRGPTDNYRIRRAAVEASIASLTSLDTARALVTALESEAGPPRSLQEYQASHTEALTP